MADPIPLIVRVEVTAFDGAIILVEEFVEACDAATLLRRLAASHDMQTLDKHIRMLGEGC